jgi:hypothetical protein
MRTLTLEIDADHSSKTMVNLYLTTCHIPEDILIIAAMKTTDLT